MSEIDLNVHLPNILEYAEDWERNDWRGMPYPAFEVLARMFPAPCQELYPLRIREDGTTEVLLMQRPGPDKDKYYAHMWHNPGTAHRSTDGVTLASSQNVEAMKVVPKNVLLAEIAKDTWPLDPREKALHRVLTGRGISLRSEEALDVIKNQIHHAGSSPLEMTPRGEEDSVLNVWVLTPEQVENIELGDGVAWFNVEDVYDMAERGEFIQHQVNRFAMMMDYVREEINETAPVLRRLEPLTTEELLDELGIESD
jgi:hypothetical protein